MMRDAGGRVQKNVSCVLLLPGGLLRVTCCGGALKCFDVVALCQLCCTVAFYGLVLARVLSLQHTINQATVHLHKNSPRC